MAIPAVVGLGLSAISTVSSISQANRQANAQEAQIEQAAADARQRIELARKEMDFVKEQAARIRDKELELNAAQRKSANLQITQQVLANELQKVQSKVQAAGLRSQADEVARSLLTTAAKEAAAQSEQGTQELRELNAQPISTVGSPGVSAATAARKQEQVLNAMAGVRGTLLAEQQARQGVANFNIAEAGTIADITRAFGQIAASDLEQQQNLQNQLIAGQADTARNVARIQGNRNKRAIEAKYYSTSATANNQALTELIKEKQYIAGLEAQRGSIQRPGFLSYVSAAGGLFNQAMQAGVISFNNRTTPTAPTQAQSGFGAGIQQRVPYQTMTDVTGNIYG